MSEYVKGKSIPKPVGTYPNTIIDFCVKNGLSNQKLADLLGINVSQTGYLKNGTRMPSDDLKIKMEAVWSKLEGRKVTFQEIFFWWDEKVRQYGDTL